MKLPSGEYRGDCKHHDLTSGGFNFGPRALSSKEEDEAEHISNHSINSHATQLASVLSWLLPTARILTLQESRQLTKILTERMNGALPPSPRPNLSLQPAPNR
eukprot:COSAG04_NODE_3135_length_3131_cov_4.159301_3_plen_103_part_00